MVASRFPGWLGLVFVLTGCFEAEDRKPLIACSAPAPLVAGDGARIDAIGPAEGGGTETISQDELVRDGCDYRRTVLKSYESKSSPMLAMVKSYLWRFHEYDPGRYVIEAIYEGKSDFLVFGDVGMLSGQPALLIRSAHDWKGVVTEAELRRAGATSTDGTKWRFSRIGDAAGFARALGDRFPVNFAFVLAGPAARNPAVGVAPSRKAGSGRRAAANRPRLPEPYETAMVEAAAGRRPLQPAEAYFLMMLFMETEDSEDFGYCVEPIEAPRGERLAVAADDETLLMRIFEFYGTNFDAIAARARLDCNDPGVLALRQEIHRARIFSLTGRTPEGTRGGSAAEVNRWLLSCNQGDLGTPRKCGCLYERYAEVMPDVGVREFDSALQQELIQRQGRDWVRKTLQGCGWN